MEPTKYPTEINQSAGHQTIISEFLQTVEMITDYAISDKQKIGMIEAEVKKEYDRLGMNEEEKSDYKEKQGKITYKVMLRQSSTQRDGKGNVIIPESELIEWFSKGLHLRHYNEWDTI